MGEEQTMDTTPYEAPKSQQEVIMDEMVKKAGEVYLQLYKVSKTNGFYTVLDRNTNERVFRSKTFSKYEDFQTSELTRLISEARTRTRNVDTSK